LDAGTTRLFSTARSALTWQFTDHGFRAHLSPELPDLLERECSSFVEEALPEGRGAVGTWVVHPGGAAILDAVERSLGLSEGALAVSREILRTHGNMSSATILYVLREQLSRMEPGGHGLMLGFGTGITIEATPFIRGPRPYSV
jgi:predicted naringenin-chalcone synthase